MDDFLVTQAWEGKDRGRVPQSLAVIRDPGVRDKEVCLSFTELHYP